MPPKRATKPRAKKTGSSRKVPPKPLGEESPPWLNQLREIHAQPNLSRILAKSRFKSTRVPRIPRRNGVPIIKKQPVLRKRSLRSNTHSCYDCVECGNATGWRSRWSFPEKELCTQCHEVQFMKIMFECMGCEVSLCQQCDRENCSAAAYEDRFSREAKKAYQEMLEEKMRTDYEVVVETLKKMPEEGEKEEPIEMLPEDREFEDNLTEEELRLEMLARDWTWNRRKVKHNTEERLQDRICDPFSIGLGAWKVPSGPYLNLQWRYYRRHSQDEIFETEE